MEGFYNEWRFCASVGVLEHAGVEQVQAINKKGDLSRLFVILTKIAGVFFLILAVKKGSHDLATLCLA